MLLIILDWYGSPVFFGLHYPPVCSALMPIAHAHASWHVSVCVCVCVTDKFEKVTNTYIIYIFLVLLRIAVRVLETFIVFVAHVCVYMYMCVCLFLCVCL